MNFASVTSVRPQERDVEAANSQGEDSDVECFVQQEDLETVLHTKTGGRGDEHAMEGAILAFGYAEKFWGEEVRAGICSGGASSLTCARTAPWNLESIAKALRETKQARQSN